MRFAVVNSDGIVQRRGNCPDTDFYGQAINEGEVVVYPALEVAFTCEAMVWDFELGQFVDPPTEQP